MSTSTSALTSRRCKGASTTSLLVRSLLKRGLRGSQRGHPGRRERTRDAGEHPPPARRRWSGRAEPGDVLVFYYSGHGSQIRDRDGDELTDLLDELICPYDMDWDRRTYILDDDLDAIFHQLPDGVLLEAFFDCCFWGASPRALDVQPTPGALRPDVRYLPPPLDIAARFESEELSLRDAPLRGLLVLQRPQCPLGCVPGRPHRRRGRVRGQSPRRLHVLRLPLHRGEASSKSPPSHTAASELLEDVRAYLHAQGYAQVPELAAPADLRAGEPFLPGAWVEQGRRWS